MGEGVTEDTLRETKKLDHWLPFILAKNKTRCTVYFLTVSLCDYWEAITGHAAQIDRAEAGRCTSPFTLNIRNWRARSSHKNSHCAHKVCIWNELLWPRHLTSLDLAASLYRDSRPPHCTKLLYFAKWLFLEKEEIQMLLTISSRSSRQICLENFHTEAEAGQGSRLFFLAFFFFSLSKSFRLTDEKKF